MASNRKILEDVICSNSVFMWGYTQVLTGEITDANIVKIHRLTGKVSYLTYSDFDKKAHPALDDLITVNLRTLKIHKRSYKESENPLILHRKETFIPQIIRNMRNLRSKLTRRKN